MLCTKTMTRNQCKVQDERDTEYRHSTLLQATKLVLQQVVYLAKLALLDCAEFDT